MEKRELPKSFEPGEYEDTLYATWEQSGLFAPQGKGEPFSIMMPPPNVTGVLHLGHAFENTLMDIMARYQRMRGRDVLLLPGTDHAAVATQARVEKNLVVQGIAHPREHFGREKLLELIRTYAEDSKATILKQIRKMGTSADWSRLAYTFDEDRSRAVNEAFVKMYNDGLIYRGYRVVNWSVKGQSTCSDDELVYVDRKAMLYTFRYHASIPFAISTTRPETKLGDTAIAVHPSDERYKDVIGKIFQVPFCGTELNLRVIADENVDPAFGTGALGVTPAHSAIDFEMYEKSKAAGHPFGIIPVIGADGNMTKEAGKDFVGLTAEQAREKVVTFLRDAGLLEEEKEIEQSVGTSDRFGDVVEALPMRQWFVAVNKTIPGRGKTLKDLMREAVASGHNAASTNKVSIKPERFEKTYFSWIDHLRDWCISRQIWWGHRIPVWYRRNETQSTEHGALGNDEIYVGMESPQGEGWEQDPDTLDTWFSSGLWTFSTLGWPHATEDLKKFHPSNWMQMGYEILFFWMARMILFSTYLLDAIPFRDVYIHGILRDKNGKKFSKSLGNGIDPVEVINTYGTDALRFSLITGVTPGNDARFYLEKVEGARHLVNKLWNIARFVLTTVTQVESVAQGEAKTLADAWILSKYETLVATVTKQLEAYEFSAASEALREFTWSDFADWYVEVAKIQRKNGPENTDRILLSVLEGLLKLWHPFLPFVTEQIYQSMNAEGRLLMVQPWPCTTNGVFDGSAFEQTKDVVSALRNLRAEYAIPPSKLMRAIIVENANALNEQEETIKTLARLEELSFDARAEKPEGAVTLMVRALKVYVPIAEVVDIEKEKARLEKDLQETQAYLERLESKKANTDFVSHAPQAVVDELLAKYEQTRSRVFSLREHIKELS